MLAVWEPRRSSCMSWPADVSKILMRVPCGNTNEKQNNYKALAEMIDLDTQKLLSRSVWLTFSEAVAIRVPCRFRAMQHSAPSWAKMSTGGFSVLAKSTIWTWPEWVPGKANRELLLLGHSTQRPRKDKKGNWFKRQTTFSLPFLMQTDPLGCSKSRTRAADGGCGWRWRL